MRPVILAPITSQTTSSPVILDTYAGSFSCSVGVIVTGTLTYSVEYTLQPLNEKTQSGAADTWTAGTVTWFPLTGLSTQTASGAITIQGPCTAVRLNVTAFSSGSATFMALQTGGAYR